MDERLDDDIARQHRRELEVVCAICAKLTTNKRYCDRCEYKIEQVRSEILYDR